jgi:hypothetical protein
MRNPRLACLRSICLAAPLIGSAYADLPSIKESARMFQEISGKIRTITIYSQNQNYFRRGI